MRRVGPAPGRGRRARRLPGQGGLRGPRGGLLCDFRRAPFSGRRRRVAPGGSEERELARAPQEALEPVGRLGRYPRAQLEVWALLPGYGGSALAALLTAAALALADACVEMYDLVVGCGLSRAPGPAPAWLLDPTLLEEERAAAGLTVWRSWRCSSRWQGCWAAGRAARPRAGRRPCPWGSRAASASTPFSSSAWCGPPAGGVPPRPSEPETRVTTDAEDRAAAAATRTRAVGLQTACAELQLRTGSTGEGLPRRAQNSCVGAILSRLLR